MAILNGFADHALHPTVREACRVRDVAFAAYDQACRNIEAGYLRALRAAHDGDSPECLHVKAQVDAVRAELYDVPLPVSQELEPPTPEKPKKSQKAK